MCVHKSFNMHIYILHWEKIVDEWKVPGGVMFAGWIEYIILLHTGYSQEMQRHSCGAVWSPLVSWCTPFLWANPRWGISRRRDSPQPQTPCAPCRGTSAGFGPVAWLIPPCRFWSCCPVTMDFNLILQMDVRKKGLKEKSQKTLANKNTILRVMRVFHFSGFMVMTP